jgi:hypothetical protein
LARAVHPVVPEGLVELLRLLVRVEVPGIVLVVVAAEPVMKAQLTSVQQVLTVRLFLPIRREGRLLARQIQPPPPARAQELPPTIAQLPPSRLQPRMVVQQRFPARP